MRLRLAPVAALVLASVADAQPARPLMPIPFANSAEFTWLGKSVLDARVLDDMTQPETWRFSGTGKISFPDAPRMGDRRVLRVDVQMFRDAPAATRSRLSSVNLRRDFGGADWSRYNRLSMWIRPDVRGFPMLPLQLVLHNDGRVKVPDRYYREGTHYVTLKNGVWQQVVWEIEPLARDSVTALEISYWVNKMLAAPGDTVAFEIGRLELQRVEADVTHGWRPRHDRFAYSHSGYRARASKSVIGAATGNDDATFDLLRVDDTALGEVVLHKRITRPAGFDQLQELDFTEITTPGTYVVRAGDRTTRQ